MLRTMWARWCAAATSLGSVVVQGLALAGHGQWGFPWSPADLHDDRRDSSDGPAHDRGPDLEPGPGELSWTEFEAELHEVLAQAAPRTGEGPRPSSEPLA